ncbi:spore germination protein [Paenibacillus cremeus]|uniref:Spore germination protein n=1 Tax=Paenibacillus cremeus TaxID=2163881 RepID=A0A559K9V7_9BACL|nr:spore germination protein [Paenibacillus cremeus]TVY08873.1 spore germination protein [Paenibacillus cremeus]
MTETKQSISEHLQTNVNWLYAKLGSSSDIVARTFMDVSSGIDGVLVYIENLVDQQTVNQMIVQPILTAIEANSGQIPPTDWMLLLKNKALSVGGLQEISTLNEVLTQMLKGNTVILLQGCRSGMSASSAGGEQRPITEPTSQSVIRGPKESFTENIHTNLSLIRRRIPSPQLRVDVRSIGKQTMTQVAVIYLDGIAKDSIVKEVMSRLDRIDADGILDSGYIEDYIQDVVFTPFPTIQNTERPDAAAAGVLEGQVAIIVNGSPFVLLAPVTFIQFFQSSEDHYQRYDISTFLRFLRFGAFFSSLLFPSLFIAITTFHQEMLPAALLVSLAVQREGVPFPAFFEALLMEFTFEVLREAGVRMPRAIGPTISIVGALVLGQAAVQAGIVSAVMVIVVSFTAITNFVIPSLNMGNAARLIRFVMMILAATLGLFGILCGLMVMLIHLASIRSFGLAYLSPLSPASKQNWKDVFVRFPRWAMKKRPIEFASQHNLTRQSSGLKPQTPPMSGHEQDPTPDTNG